MSARSFKTLFEEAEKHLDYWIAGAEIELTEEIARVMDEDKVSRAELARRLGTSRAYITNVLRGEVSLTLAEIVGFARALDTTVALRLVQQRSEPEWQDAGCITIEVSPSAQASVGRARVADCDLWAGFVEVDAVAVQGTAQAKDQVALGLPHGGTVVAA